MELFNLIALLQVVDAYALIGDVSGLAEKIRSYFMQEVLSETHSALKVALIEVITHGVKVGDCWILVALALQPSSPVLFLSTFFLILRESKELCLKAYSPQLDVLCF